MNLIISFLLPVEKAGIFLGFIDLYYKIRYNKKERKQKSGYQPYFPEYGLLSLIER